jgi:hypothetical protein
MEHAKIHDLFNYIWKIKQNQQYAGLCKPYPIKLPRIKLKDMCTFFGDQIQCLEGNAGEG